MTRRSAGQATAAPRGGKTGGRTGRGGGRTRGKDNKENDKIIAKTRQNREQTGSVEKSRIKSDKVKAHDIPSIASDVVINGIAILFPTISLIPTLVAYLGYNSRE
nr:hypothetical protein [Tanacetum cinerariifolium]